MIQRYSCLGARKIICWSKFPDIHKNKEKIKEKKRQIRKRKKEKKFWILNFCSVNSVSGVDINKNV